MNGKYAVAFMMTLAMPILEHYTFSPMFLRQHNGCVQGAVGLDTGASNGIRNGTITNSSLVVSSSEIPGNQTGRPSGEGRPVSFSVSQQGYSRFCITMKIAAPAPASPRIPRMSPMSPNADAASSPAIPRGPVAPAVPSEPAEPCEPCAPVAPCAPAGPVGPPGPCGPVGPATPEGPRSP